jgi:hypothetical protein
MSKSATLESSPDSAVGGSKRSRKARARTAATSAALTREASAVPSHAFPTKPLLIGAGVGAALALTGVALASRRGKSVYFDNPPTVVRAFAKTIALLLARAVARKALAMAANQGARKLASAWPM